MSKVDIDELVHWRDTCEALAASLQRKVRHCDEIEQERDNALRERDEARAERRELAEVAARNVNDASHLRRSAIELTRERDEARASVADAYRRGAEAMREACAIRGGDKAYERMTKFWPPASGMKQAVRDAIRALPIPEEPC